MHEDSDLDLLIVKGGCSTGTETTRIYDALPSDTVGNLWEWTEDVRRTWPTSTSS